MPASKWRQLRRRRRLTALYQYRRLRGLVRSHTSGNENEWRSRQLWRLKSSCFLFYNSLVLRVHKWTLPCRVSAYSQCTFREDSADALLTHTPGLTDFPHTSHFYMCSGAVFLQRDVTYRVNSRNATTVYATHRKNLHASSTLNLTLTLTLNPTVKLILILKLTLTLIYKRLWKKL